MIDLDSTLADVSVTEEYPEDAILMTDSRARVRLSHSTNSLLRGCERKFQLTKMLHNRAPRESTPATVFGKAYGAAAQHYMVLRTLGESREVALASAEYEAFKNYSPVLEDDRRFLERVLYCINAAAPFHEQRLMEWEIAELGGKFAAEMSFKINIDERYYYVGYLDLVLRHRTTGRYAATDYKSTSLRGEDLSPMFKFSDQVLGYTMVLDAAAGKELTEFDTNFWVCQLPSGGMASLYEPQFKSYTFPKTLADRFEWFTKLYLDVNYLETLRQLKSYPKRGNYCKAYSKTCHFFGSCQFSAADRPAIYVPDEIEYQFEYNLEDLFLDHQQRLQGV